MAPAAVRELLLAELQKQLGEMARTSALAAAFAFDAANIPKPALQRHLIEHVHRIRLLRPLDAAATAHLQTEFPALADKWAQYARSEAVHDRYFLRDLQGAGVDRERIDRTPPLAATMRLVAFLEQASQVYGHLPAVLYSFWAERNSEAGSPKIAERTLSEYGAAAAAGALAHRALDEKLDHTGLIEDILEQTVRTPDEASVAVELLQAITNLLGQYFAELQAWVERPAPEVIVRASVELNEPVPNDPRRRPR